MGALCVGFLLMEKTRSLAMPCKKKFWAEIRPVAFPKRFCCDFLVQFLGSSAQKLHPGSLQNLAALFLWVKTKCLIAFFWQEHGSKSLSLTTLVECLLLLHWDGNFYWKMAAMFFRCSPQWDQVLFSAKGRQNPSLFVGEKFLCWRAITSWFFFAFLDLLAGNSNLKIFIPRENSRKVQPCCPKRLLVWANAWWAAFKGKTISKMPYARRIQGHFLVHVLQLGVYLQLASGILFTKEGQTILELIDDWIRSHNCHEKACHQKKVSCADQQQPVVFTALLLVSSLTSWRTITFLRTHPSREGIRSSMRKVQIAWCSPAPCGTWSRSSGCSSTTADTEDPSGTCTHRECDGPLRCGGEPKIENSLAAQRRPFGYCQANNEESCIQILGRHLNRNFILFVALYPPYPTDI